MSFSSVLNSYCDALGCTNTVIAQRCGISVSSLSRYRSGDRVPTNSEIVEKIAEGVAGLSSSQGGGESLSQEEIYLALEAARKGLRVSGDAFGDRVNRIMEALDLKNADVARVTGIDPSFLSRIRSGKRAPSNHEALADVIARLAARRLLSEGGVDQLIAAIPSAAKTLESDWQSYDSEALLTDDISQWLLGDAVTGSDVGDLEHMFSWFDSFDFASYNKRMGEFADMPEMDLAPRARFYYGVDDMQAAELEFLDIAAYSCAQNVYLASDMPMLGGVADDDFLERIIHRTELIVRRGGLVHAIHNVDRPLAELIAIMSDWIPLYMTGRVVPLHIRGVSNRLFNHVNYSCETCALSAEFVAGHPDGGRHYLSLLPEDVAYYAKKMKYVVEKTEQVLEIFLESRPGDFERFEADEQRRRASRSYREVCAGKFENIRIRVLPGDCAVVSYTAEPKTHLVIKHPKVRYAISLMS